MSFRIDLRIDRALRWIEKYIQRRRRGRIYRWVLPARQCTPTQECFGCTNEASLVRQASSASRDGGGARQPLVLPATADALFA